jgi:hypothetical protein
MTYDKIVVVLEVITRIVDRLTVQNVLSRDKSTLILRHVPQL